MKRLQDFKILSLIFQKGEKEKKRKLKEEYFNIFQLGY